MHLLRGQEAGAGGHEEGDERDQTCHTITFRPFLPYPFFSAAEINYLKFKQLNNLRTADTKASQPPPHLNIKPLLKTQFFE